MSSPQPHLVLARRYRPQKFSDLIGQEPVVRMLQNALKADRLGHALLFHGERGIGKTTLARIIARVLNCTHPFAQETFEPCNACETCCAILEDRHMDVIEMDAASHTSVDDVRPLIEAAVYRPQSARYKVYMIDEVHMLSKSAFNALLKTLEEPPPHLKFIFATTEIRRLPATIISRCLKFDLRRVPVEVLTQHFSKLAVQEGYTVEEEALKLVAHAADGSVRDGLSILDQVLTSGVSPITAESVHHLLGLSNMQDMMGMMGDLIEGHWDRVKERLQAFNDQGTDAASILQECLTLVHHMTQLKMSLHTPAHDVLYPLETLKEWSSKVSLPWLLRVWQILLKGLGDLKSALRPDYVVEMTLTLCVLIRDTHTVAAEETSTTAPSAPVQAIQVDQHKTLPLPSQFTDVIRLFEEHKEMLLASHLRHDVELVSYEPGTLTIHVRPQAPADFIQRITKYLHTWTGYAWNIIPSKTAGKATIVEQEKAQDQVAKDQVLHHPVTQAIQKAFPGAKEEWIS